MNSFPVRFFHACLSGILAGLILSLLFFHMQGRFLHPDVHRQKIVDITPSPLPAPSPVSLIPGPPPPTEDTDGIPTSWENQFHHDPYDGSDAGSDFDNDGLTALQEYELYQRTSGTSGNPLGHWHKEQIAIPQNLGIQSVSPLEINNHGQILVRATGAMNGAWTKTVFLIDSQGNWTEVTPADESELPYADAYDLNENGEVVGVRHSSDWSNYEYFIWDSNAGYRPFTFQGENACALKINNRGDWIGYLYDAVTYEWRPALVIDGVNWHSAEDWWPYASYTDINDYGEVLGTFYDYGTDRYNAFIAYGDWLFDTGLMGGLPLYGFDYHDSFFTSDMNEYGEFAGGASGTRQDDWEYLGYQFDGEFKEIKLAGHDQLYSVSPYSLNATGMIIGIADEWYGNHGGFLYCDRVGLFINELLPNSGLYEFSRINDHNQFVARTHYSNQLFLVSPDQDADGDGMSDEWEDFYGLDKNSAADAYADTDGDGTNNLGEFLLRSDPEHPPVEDEDGQDIDLRPGIDTDGDGTPNTWEWTNGLNYDDATDAPLDYDRDGYSNLQEYRLNTDPRGAPSYRMRVIGPFPSANGATLQATVLGDGISSGNATYLGGNITETVQFPASPDAAGNNGQRPASWSVPRSGTTGTFSISSSLSNTYCSPVVHSPSGTSLYYRSASPCQFFFWPSNTAQPVTLSGAANENDISNLQNARISASGIFVVGQRYSVSSSSYQPVVWKMPASPSTTYKPIRLVPPAGVSISDWATLYVNDHGYVLANGNVSGQSRPILWKVSADGLAVTSSILPPLSGSNWANASGISNQDPPLICGNSSASNQQRAVVWTAAGAITNLGTLPGGNYSSASLISRGGSIAGIANVLVGNTLKQQPFLATYICSISSWKLQPQGEPSANYTPLTSVNDFGEILGTIYQYTPTYRQIRTLWRHGRAYSIESCFSGALLDNATQLSPNGTLLATVNKEGSSLTVLLTPDRDTDNDGLPDAYENQHGFNAFVKNSPATDSDSDTLSDLEEFRSGTDPRNPDTDGDGMKDGWEVSWGLLPLDPTDAPLDPDNDRVTNLRESEIGTTPTGIYKVETRLSGESWSNCWVHAASDMGQIVFGANSTSNSYTDESGVTHNEYSQQYFALPPADPIPSETPMPLPGAHGYYSYNSDWSEYYYNEEYVSYYPDQSTNQINATLNRFLQDPLQGWNESYFLITDIANSSDESTWLQWFAVEENLRNSELLQYDDFLQKYPDAVSPSGTYRIHHSNNTWEYLILTNSGEFIDRLPFYNSTWRVNDSGIAAGLETSYYDPDWNWVENSPRIRLSTGETVTIPNEAGTMAYYTLIHFSNDGKVLLCKQAQNEQLAYCTQYFLFDAVSGSLTRIRQPGFGNETIDFLSNQNGRILGNGPKPFQVTPDGTCIRLEALRIKNSPSDENPVIFGSLYPKTLSPNHIASNGRITLTTTDDQNQQVILQLEPFNDSDNDGMPDDWETANNLTDPFGDADSDGLGNAVEFTSGTEVSNQDSDGDGIPDGKDNQPTVNAQQFPDADGDGIPDAEDPDPDNPRGPAPSVSSETASGNPLSNLIKGETVKFVITVSNPAGPAPTASNLTFFLNGTAETESATITAIGSPVGSSQRFLLTWNAKTTANYPTTIIQNLTLRFRDSQNATSWFSLARVDVAEWEGMIATLRTGGMDENPLLNVNYYHNGLKSKSMSTYSMDVGLSQAGWYRGPKKIDFLNAASGAVLATGNIDEGMRYPLFPVDVSGSGALSVSAPISISSPADYTHHGYMTFNNTGTDTGADIRRTFTPGGSNTVSVGDWGYIQLPKREDSSTGNAGYLAEFLADGEWKILTGSTVALYPAQSRDRRISSRRYSPGTRVGNYPSKYLELRALVETSIIPHAAGTLGYSGLPLPVICHADPYIYINYQPNRALLPIASEQWHKIVLKVGPDADAVSNGIGLWLRKGENGDADPQSDFSLKIQGDNGTLEDLAVPPDGKITIPANDPKRQRLASSQGLTLFMKRDSNVTDAHDLSLQLLKKHEWYPQEAVKIASLTILPMEVVAHKSGTLNAPGAQVPRGIGEFGYETVMMENGDSQSAVNSTARDCEQSGDLNDYRKANDDDFVKVVLKFPAATKLAGASLKLLHEGMQVDATKITPEAAVSSSGYSRLKFYKADGKLITDPAKDLQIPDLANPPADRYLSKIVTDGEVTIFIEGGDEFGNLPITKMAQLGGAILKWEFQKGEMKVTEKLLVYRGGFLRFVQPAGAPGTVGRLEFWDGKGRVRHEWGGYGNEFKKDDTDMGILLASWSVKSGKTSGKAYNISEMNGHTPPGWWRQAPGGELTGRQPDQVTGSGNTKKIKQGAYRKWKQDDESDPAKRYTTSFRYDASIPHDREIDEPVGIGFKYNMVPITANDPQPKWIGTEPEVKKISEAQNRNEIQIHPDGECNGTAGCIGIQKFRACNEIHRMLQNYHSLKVKVIVQ